MQALRDRLQKNETSLGQASEAVARADEQAVIFLLADDAGAAPATRVWAGSSAAWDSMKAYTLRLCGGHFTALFPKQGTIL